jgi:uncharacterized protein (TIGR00290 family)
VSIHGVRRALVNAQASAAGLPLFEVTLEQASSNDAYETALAESLRGMRARFPEVRRIAFGDLFLEDVREYRERLLSAHGFEALFPLWGRDTGALAREFIDAGFHAHLVCVDTMQLSAQFAGRAFDASLLEELPHNVDPCGERGEFHTFVSEGPIFTEAIRVRRGETVLRENRFMYCDLLADDDAVVPH